MNILDEIIVVKRSGQRINFNGSKIAVAIKSAFDDVSSNYKLEEVNKVYETVLKYIVDNYKTRRTINVEDIQDIIENVLKKQNIKVYEAFVKYRTRRAESRKVFSLKQQHKFVKVIEKVNSISSLETPNNNLLKYGEIISREYIKSYILDNKYTRLHDEGRIYIHNLSYFSLGYLNHTHLKIESKMDNLIKELLDSKTEINGEVVIDELDIKLYKYEIKKYKNILKNKISKYLDIIGLKDYINIKKINEKIDKIDNIDFDLNILDEYLLNDQVKNIINFAYKDSKEEFMNYISDKIESLLITLNKNISINQKYGISISKNDNFIRNIIIDKIEFLNRLDNVTLILKIGNNYDIENIYKLLDKNIKLVFNDQEYFTNGLLIKDGYGKSNISYTSINIARLGIKHKKLDNNFYKELDELIELTKNELLFVFETIGDKTKENYSIIFNSNILDDEKLEENQKVRKVIKNGTLNINLVGLLECSYIIDKDNYSKIILKIISYVKNKIDDISKETKLNFTLSSIHDNSCKELIILDKTIYGIIDKITKKDYYQSISTINDLQELSLMTEYNKYLNGGYLINLKTKNLSIKYLREIIDECLKNNIGILELRCT